MEISSILLQLLGGFGKSMGIYFLTLLFSLPLGMLVALGRMSKKPLVRGPIIFYISLMRGTPLMLQLIFVYYMPYALFGWTLSPGWRFYAVIIAFVINYAAYFAEIFRSGIQSVPTGQYEAADVLGYSRRQTFMGIILPQVIKRILPSVTNEIITLVKDTSLAFAIAYVEMFTIAKQIVARESNLVALIVAGLFYYVFNYAVAAVMNRFEKKLSYYKI
ncbi:MAG: amino acid ABC transporter permease [Lachnospiraceae bacterium]|nr:amino acid ABC transporter permease [Lachnospiraceae bacterium]